MAASASILPAFIAEECSHYLRCGILSHGCIAISRVNSNLLQFALDDQGHGGYRAHLRDRVLPSVPVRQWVFTPPKWLRFLLAWRPKLISLALRLFLRAPHQKPPARRAGYLFAIYELGSKMYGMSASKNLELNDSK